MFQNRVQSSSAELACNKVKVTFALSAEEIYLQYCQDEYRLVKLTKDIQKAAQISMLISTLTEGLRCIAKWPVDNCWHRAQILKAGETESLIRFVDYGELLLSENVNLRVMEDRFNRQPFLAFKAKLADVVSRKESKKTQFQYVMKIQENEFLMTVVEEEPTGIKSVRLARSHDGQDVAWLLVREQIVDVKK